LPAGRPAAAGRQGFRIKCKNKEAKTIKTDDPEGQAYGAGRGQKAEFLLSSGIWLLVSGFLIDFWYLIHLTFKFIYVIVNEDTV